MKVIVDFGNDGFKVDAEVCIEGNKWCCFAGDFALMPAGFGNTVQSAICDFKSNIRNDRPPKLKEIPTETPEEKEALDAIERVGPEAKTYRYEKVEFTSDKEKAEAFLKGELRYFTHGEVKGDMERDTIPVTRLDELLCGNAMYRRIEVTERELELEAAYDLYYYVKKESIYSCVIVGFNEFVSDFPANEREEYLAIVRKTGYRKGE